MTVGRILATVAGAIVVALGAAGCTGSDDVSSVRTSTSTSTSAAAPPTTPPALAGAAEARAVAALPAGAAGGSALLSYSGVGRLDEPFSGDCSRSGETTVIAGTADTARIRLEVGPAGGRLELQDVGFSADAELAQGRYEISGNHLSLDAPLVRDEQVVGRAQLEIDCR